MAESAVGELIAARTGRQWCLFVDRDGVLNRRIVDDYVRTWAQFDWLPGAKTALRSLRAWAPHLVVVTNQQGVGKRLMSLADVTDIHAHMRADLAELSVAIDDFQVCPHLAAAACDCRKPKPGLVLDWLDRHPGVDPTLSVMVGDSPSDLELAHNVAAVTGGCVGIEIGSEISTAAASAGTVAPYASFGSLRDFADDLDRGREEQDS